jgi:hypothetical protein
MAYQTSQGLASLGRNGDSVLVHMNPTEVAGLQNLAMSQGGSLTINPHTGLPEAFSLSGVFSSLLPMFAGAMFPGAGFAMQPLLAGALTGGVLAKVQGKDPLMGGLMGGLGGIGGSNLAQGLGGAASGVAAGGSTPYSLAGGYVDPSTIGAMVGPQAPGTALANTGLQSSQSMMMNPVVRNAVQATQQAGGILPNTGSFMDKELTALSNAGRGAGNLITGKPGAFEGFKNAFIDPKTGTGALTNFQAATKIGMPVGGALLGGLEPSDIYGKPINMDEAKRKQKYDPNATLNLSGDTGLRLYATGGTIQSGGIRDLYGTPDNQPTISPGLSGFGLGRLNNLAGEQAMTQAQTLGYADGGEVEGNNTGMNLDQLPSLNLNTGTNSSSGLSSMSGDALYSFNDKAAFSPVGRMLLSKMPQSDRAKFINSGMGVFFGMQERPKQEYYTSSGELTSRYAMGGPVSFADGGDSNKEDALGLPSLSPDMSMDPNAGAGNLAMIQSAMQPTQGMQGNAPMTQGQMPDQSNDSLIAKVTANLRADPNYQPTNPIEASIVKQIKGTDPMQQGQPSLQGLGSLGPSQPMAPSFNPSVAMGPTYFAGMNAPRGYAEGGDVSNYGQDQASLNLDALPSLNVNTGMQSYGSSSEDYINPIQLANAPMGREIMKGQYVLSRLGSGKNPLKMTGSDASSTMNMLVKSPALREMAGIGSLTSSGFSPFGFAKGGYLDGAGDGMSDSIPATIEGKQPARLADGEFVIPADVVSHIGNGSSKAGSKRLYAMLDKVRHARTGNKKQGKEIKAEKYLPA